MLLISSPQDRGRKRELACYPAGDLGLHRINHTRFRDTEFCVADQFSSPSCRMIKENYNIDPYFIFIDFVQTADFNHHNIYWAG